jgi:hypothetical protein
MPPAPTGQALPRVRGIGFAPSRGLARSNHVSARPEKKSRERVLQERPWTRPWRWIPSGDRAAVLLCLENMFCNTLCLSLWLLQGGFLQHICANEHGWGALRRKQSSRAVWHSSRHPQGTAAHTRAGQHTDCQTCRWLLPYNGPHRRRQGSHARVR